MSERAEAIRGQVADALGELQAAMGRLGSYAGLAMEAPLRPPFDQVASAAAVMWQAFEELEHEVEHAVARAVKAENQLFTLVPDGDPVNTSDNPG